MWIFGILITCLISEIAWNVSYKALLKQGTPEKTAKLVSSVGKILF